MQEKTERQEEKRTVRKPYKNCNDGGRMEV